MQGVSDRFLEKEMLPVLDCWSEDMITAYTGSDRKEGLIAPDGQRYLIKYAEAHTRINDLDTSYVNNVISEYMASHICFTDTLQFGISYDEKSKKHTCRIEKCVKEEP